MKLLFRVLILLLAAGLAAGQNAAPPLPGNVELVRDIESGQGGGRTLKLDIVRPKPQPASPMPVVVWVHGGGWRSGNKEQGLARIIPLAQRGYLGVTVEYRLSQEAIFPAQIEDVKCAIRFLRAKAKEYGLDSEHIGAWGSSAGGHLVALLGTSGDVTELEGKGGWADYSSRVQAVVDWFGPTDFSLINRPDPMGAENLLLGGTPAQKPELARLASPVAHVSADDPPFLIQHGNRDPLVPVEQSKLFEAALKAAGVSAALTILPGAAHGGPAFTTTENLEKIYGFFDQVLLQKR
ncbi:MAG: alpha/beta hydrolase [Deinococcus sp.]|nr:alpha/beta hydrolase [Deinococcus sp.]